MSPLATLRRGYAVVQDADGHVVTSVTGTAAGQGLQVRVADGRLGVVVRDTTPIDDPQEQV
jgi:exodeoxyribonuclease VII large subunit